MKKIISVVALFLLTASIATAQQQTAHYAYPQYKNPALAYFFSFIPGAGQFYNDQIEKGFSFMVSTALTSAGAYYMLTYDDFGKSYSLLMSASSREKLSIGLGIVAIGLYVWSSIDAVVTANELNKRNGYVVHISPSFQYNTLASTNGGSGFVSGVNLSLSF